MRKRGVLTGNESENQRNKKLGWVSLSVQNFVKPKISERLNSDPAIQIASPKATKFC